MTQLALNPTGRTGYAARRRSPTAMAAAIAFNGGVIALLLALPAAQAFIPETGILETHNIFMPREKPKDDVKPKHDPVKTQKPLPQAPEQAFVTPPVAPFETNNEIKGTTEIILERPTFIKPVEEVVPLPPHKPVFASASRDPRYAEAFTPPYPPELVRQELEGSVTVRITINEQGRVIACDLVKATNKAFYEETREQALKRWRFRPATSDGVPVQSQQTLTVHFELDA